MNAINNKITYNVVKDIREEAFAKLQILPLKFIDAHSYGDIVGRNVADVDQHLLRRIFQDFRLHD